MNKIIAVGVLLVLSGIGCIGPMGKNNDAPNPLTYPVMESMTRPMNENNGVAGEKAFIEAQLFITNAEASNYGSPPKFGLLKDRQYVLKFTAEKLVVYLGGEMETNILLPEEFQIIDGELAWSGTDKKKSRRVIIKPVQNGDYLITANVKNLDFYDDPTILNGSATYVISVSVRDTGSEAKEAIK